LAARIAARVVYNGEMPVHPKLGRKLLMASVGVAAVSYVACSNTETSGNLVAPPGDAAAGDANDDFPTSGNLLPPPQDARVEDVIDDFVTSGNLIAQPQDAGDAGKDAPSDG